MKETIEQIRDLIEKLKEYDKAYNEGTPLISDMEYDLMYFDLVKLENQINCHFADSPTQCINYQVVNSLNKVVHNHAMLSLDKTKDWNTFIQYFGNHDVVGMTKLDGLTCSLRYENGHLVGAETRGNGVVGEDILHNALVVANIPNRINYKDELVLDGEIICSYHNFAAFENEFANPRNFAAGSIRLLDSAECAKRGLQFVAWDLIVGGTNSHIDNLNLLQSLGFTVTPWTSSFDWDAREFLINEAKRLGYPIDGLVGRFNDINYGQSLGATSHHSRAAYAFKFADETAKTSLKDIEWTMGRTGVLTPVAIFEPIELEGTTVERANLHNISIMKEVLHGFGFKGQELTVFKSNMIIPQIQESEDLRDALMYCELPFIDIPTECPICGGRTEQVTEVDSTILICSNPQCEGKLINRLDHFCGKKGLDIKGLSKATLEKLIEWNWISDYTDIFNLSNVSTEWKKKPGFGEKSVTRILTAIEEGKNCELYQFISALGIPLIGINASKVLAEHFETWENFIAAAENNEYPFYDIPGFGTEMHYSLTTFDYSVAKYLYTNYLNIKPISKTVKNDKLKNKVFCITGTVHKWKNRDELVEFINMNGGRVSVSVSKNTTYLINNNINSTSGKNVAAKKLNIPIITEDELLSLLENNS